MRKAAKLTQAELAELVGDSQRNIAYWEQSEKPPRSDVLPRLAEVLGVTIEEILGLQAPKKKKRAGPVGKVQQLFDQVSKLPRSEQKKVIEFVSAFVEQHKRSAS